MPTPGIDAPIGRMILSANTSGSGRRNRRSSANASRFTRTSLYSQNVPGGRSGRASPLRPLPSTARFRLRSIMSGLPNSVPSHSDVCCSRCRQVIAPLCGPSNPPSLGSARHSLVQVADQPVGNRNTGQQAQVALGHREGEVDLLRVAPARQHRTCAHDQSVRSAARTNGPENFVLRRRFEKPSLEVRPQIAWPGCFVFHGVTNCLLQRRHRASFKSPRATTAGTSLQPGYHVRNRTRILAPGSSWWVQPPGEGKGPGDARDQA